MSNSHSRVPRESFLNDNEVAIYSSGPDINYVAGTTTLQWSQTAQGGNPSGTLTVTDGSHAANITLLGQYAEGDFAVASGPVGGTLLTAPLAEGGALTDANVIALTNARHG